MADMTLILWLLSSVIILVSCVRLLYSNRTPPNFPPGPPRLPLLGNLHQIPLEKGYMKIAELCWKYGSHGLMGLQFGPNTRVVVINSWKAARDLLEQRGAIYSSRPSFVIASEVLPPPGDFHLALLKYGSKWRKERRTFMEYMKKGETEKRLPIQEAESSQLMYELLVEPERFHEHVLRYHGAIIMASVFGKRAKEYVENSEIERFFDMERDWTAIMAPGSVPPYDIFPFLKIVPDFLTPWRGWKQKTRSVRQRQRSLYQDLITGVKDRMAQGRSQECFLADVLHNNEKHGYSEIDLEYLGGVLLEGGADTTAGAFETFLMAMAAYPSILKMAQEEVDGIFGNDKIPTGVTDAELPFLSACFLEVVRWRPGIASGIAHATTQDDTYEGFFIPANTPIVMNIWGINHDPEEFDHPHVFDPTRFLQNPNGSKRGSDDAPNDNGSSSLRRPVYTFGAGRRVCVGKDMAKKSMLLTMAKVVWCFDIEAVSADELDTGMRGFHSGLLITPKPFKARFRVRGEDRKRIIEREWEKADAYLNQFG